MNSAPPGSTQLRNPSLCLLGRLGIEAPSDQLDATHRCVSPARRATFAHPSMIGQP